MSNLVQAAIQQLQTGGTKQADGTTGTPVPAEEVGTDSSSVLASDSTVDGEEGTQEDGTESPNGDSSNTDPKADPQDPAKAQASGTSTKEVIIVTDDKGKRKVEIDYSDRASIKKAFELMHGARKWQAERDRATAAEKDLSEKYGKMSKVVDALERAFQEKGELGVIDLIAGKSGASEEFIRRQVDRAKFLERASPEEKEQLAQKERLETLERELARQKQEGQTREERIKTERETAELRSLESTVHPAFEKYRFDGKLGSADDEDMFDEMLWNTALKRLKPYEEQKVEITREMVEREFRTVASALRKRIGAQAEKKAAAVVTQKKQEATENAQASTMNAYKKGGDAAEAQDLIQKGDFQTLLKNWGKFGKTLRRG